MIIHSSLPDFIVFLYVHLAQVDTSYDPKELSVIKSKMKGLFPDGTDLEKKLYQTLREYQKLEKSAIYELCTETITHYRKSDEQLTARLAKDLGDIVRADGHVEKSEQDALAKLEEILRQQTPS